MDDAIPAIGEHAGHSSSSFLHGLAGRLREARSSSGLSQLEVCQRADCTTRSLTRWEHGECDPGIQMAWQLADIYHVSIDWMVGSTPLRDVMGPGRVVVDDAAIDLISRLVKNGGSLRDLPKLMVRYPGVEYAWVVPNQARIISVDAACRVDDHVVAIMRELSRRR